MVDIADLDPNTPTGQDLVSRGDDEIVRIKQALNQDFGGIDGPVFEDADVDGLNGTTLMSAAVLSSFNARIQANADAIAAFNPYIVGQIILWSGSIGSIPAGWALCDGANGTPDLRDAFVRGAGGALSPGDEGGAASVNTGNAGAHSHSGSSVGDTALTEAQMPSHRHKEFANALVNGDTRPLNANPTDQPAYFGDNVGNSRAYKVQGSTSEATLGDSGPAGSGAAHGHGLTVASDGNHNHSVATVPPFYALAYIMYVGA